MKRKILVADDDLREIETLKSLLRPKYAVILAYNGLEAVDVFNRRGEGGIDGAILDYQMMGPGNNRLKSNESHRQYYGDAVARKFRDAGFTGPIIIRSMIADMLGTNVQGLDVYLHKKNTGDEKILDYLVCKFQVIKSPKK